MNRMILALALLLPASACGPRDEDPGVGGVSVGEAKALNAAATMLDANMSDKDRPASAPAPGGAPLPPPPPQSTPPRRPAG